MDSKSSNAAHEAGPRVAEPNYTIEITITGADGRYVHILSAEVALRLAWRIMAEATPRDGEVDHG